MNIRSTSTTAALTLNYDEVLKYINETYLDSIKDKVNTGYKKRYSDCRHVLNEFLGLYKVVRHTDSYFKKAKYLFEKATSYLTGEEPQQDVVDTIYRELPPVIRSVASFQGILCLLVELRKYAEICQGKKYLHGASLLCLTLHAMACYLLAACRNDFKELTSILEAERAELLVQPKEDYKKNKGINVRRLNEKYQLVTLALALLNEFEGVNSASRMGKLPYYALPTTDEINSCDNLKVDIDLNHGLPIIYQEICIHYVYQNWYSAKQMPLFVDFVRTSIVNGERAEKKAKKEIQSTTLPYYDWLAVSELPDTLDNLPGDSPYVYILTSDAIWYVERESKKCEKLDVTDTAINDLMKYYSLNDHNDKKNLPEKPVFLDVTFSEIELEKQRANDLETQTSTVTEAPLIPIARTNAVTTSSAGVASFFSSSPSNSAATSARVSEEMSVDLLLNKPSVSQ